MTNHTVTKKKIAVVGAGAGGVCAAKYALQAGHDVTVYEAGSYVGGLWKYENDNGHSQAYRNLCIITPREKTKFHDHPFDDRTPRFPSHYDMYRYVHSYAERFGVLDHVRFRTPVKSVEPAFTPGNEEPKWKIVTESGDTETYDAVMVATGHLNEPQHIADFQTKFGGQYLHSNEYRIAEPFVGKRVVVIGTGNSGVDIASDVCPVASRTVLVARDGVRINPKVVAGIAYPDVALTLRKPWIPAFFRNKVLQFMIWAAHGDQTRLGFKPPRGRQHPTSSESIVSHIEFGRVVVKPGITEIRDKTLVFEDGTEEEFDVLIAATGYKVVLPFIADSVVPVKGNRVDLYQRIFPVDWPGLFFIAMLNPLTAYSLVFESQSRVIMQYLAGQLTLPSKEEMNKDIEARLAVTAATYTKAPRHEMEEADPVYPANLDILKGAGLYRARHKGRLAPWMKSRFMQRRYWKMNAKKVQEAVGIVN